MAAKNFCVHGHFYQPPREDPETGLIPDEPGAGVYRNWNEKITVQCYRPNAALGNFSRISFDLGPTLAGWLKREHPDILAEIVRQETDFVARTGVSNAIAQSYNHTILPLATRADKETQIRWGIADYKARFGHSPEGLWAPETAIDIETLEVMAENGIKFTILAPWQADPAVKLDPARPYRAALPNGSEIALFFFDRDLSLSASFNPEATIDADRYLRDLLIPKFPPRSRIPRTLLIASDGELYGHHQPRREEFLQWLTTGAAEMAGLKILVPAQILQSASKLTTIRIQENTSWSCHHGVLRWSGECGCAERGEWKAPLRAALNFLADVIDYQTQRLLTPYGLKLQSVRNDYASVLTGAESAEAFAARTLDCKSGADTERLAELMKIQYERQRMFTSCGWFFEEFDRIEPKNNIRYAARAARLFDRLTGMDLETELRDRLAAVRSRATGLSGDKVLAAG